MQLKRIGLAFALCLPAVWSFAQEGEGQNRLNKRLFYSKPSLHHSPSKLRLNLAAFNISVAQPTDDRASFYGELIYKGKKAEPLEEFFALSTPQEIQNKISADLKAFKVRPGHAGGRDVVITPTVEIFYPKVRGFINGESFAEVRLDIGASLNGALIIHEKYQALYVTDGSNNGFEGDLSMTTEQGENITVGMALRIALDQFYGDLQSGLTLPRGKVLITGRVVDAKTHAGVAAVMQFMLDSAISVSPGGQGVFAVTGRPGTYHVQVAAANYVTIFTDIDASTLKVVRRDFLLKPIEKGVVVRLNNVLFSMGTTELLPDSFHELDAVVSFLKSNPKVKIELQGHTDNRGDAQKDVVLSQQRVEKIKSYLTSKGVGARRLGGKGFGGAKPIATNETEEGRRQNRRVEFVILRN